MDNAISGIVTVLVAIVGVATLAVLVSPKAKTAGVISAGGTAFAQALNAATGPVTGATSGFGGAASLGGLTNYASF